MKMLAYNDDEMLKLCEHAARYFDAGASLIQDSPSDAAELYQIAIEDLTALTIIQGKYISELRRRLTALGGQW